ncbi:MAG: sdpR 3 [Phycisphaerales bacterium]|nr:sdpR 3 [Phycisphaerales bacterium]
MARRTVSSDPFEAIAQPKRRQVLETLARYPGAGCPVNELVVSLGLPQPVVSKHLAVLKGVGLVSLEKRGRQRFYRVNGEGIRAVHEWAARFERFWTHQLTSIKERAERRARDLPTPNTSEEPRRDHD